MSPASLPSAGVGCSYLRAGRRPRVHNDLHGYLRVHGAIYNYTVICEYIAFASSIRPPTPLYRRALSLFSGCAMGCQAWKQNFTMAFATPSSSLETVT